MIKKLIKGKHSVEMEHLLKKLPNGKKVFDFKRIREIFSDFNMFVVASERGSLGKTTGLKLLALDDLEKNGVPSLFIRNTITDLETEVPRFLSESTLEVDDRFLECEIEGSVVKSTATCKYKDKTYFNFCSLNDTGKIKGSRIIYNNIVWDEINEGFLSVRGGITTSISSILASTEDQVKNYGKKDETNFWVFCNMKSINHPFILDLGIRDFDENITTYHSVININGKKLHRPLCVIIRTSYTEDEKFNYIKENYSNSWRLGLNLATGEAEHTNFNETLKDEATGIKNFDPKKCNLWFTLRNDKSYVNIFKIWNTDSFWVHTTDSSYVAGESVYILDTKYSTEGVMYQNNLKKSLFKKLWNGEIYFKDMAARVKFLNILNVQA